MRWSRYLYVKCPKNLYKTLRFTFTTEYSSSAANDEQSQQVSLRAVEDEETEGKFCLTIDMIKSIARIVENIRNCNFGDNIWLRENLVSDDKQIEFMCSKKEDYMIHILFEDGRKKKLIGGSIAELLLMIRIAKDCGSFE